MATTHEPGVHIDDKGKKTFIPLENNPEIFTELIHRLGVSPQLAFHDVYSVSEPELLALVPRPAHALIFISPGDVYYRVHGRSAPQEIHYDGSGGKEPVVWFKQTIGNACGLIALMHSVSNGPARAQITPGSTLDGLLKEGLPLKPQARADVLYNSVELEKAYMASARKGDSVAPAAEDNPGYHFLAFVKGKDNHLYELEGSYFGPVDLGDLGDEEDCLSERAIELGVGRYVKAAQGSMEFSIIALAGQSEDGQVTNGS